MTDIIDHLPDATFAIDVNGTVIAWNRAMEEMTGVNHEQILGTRDHSYAVPFYGMKRPILLDLVLREDKEIENKYPHIIRKDNKLISEISTPLLYGGKGAYLWFIASPLYDPHRNLVGAIESIRDITVRKNAEEALKESEERYRAVVEDQTEFITRFLPDGTHVFVNKAYCRYFKKTPAEIIGTTFTPQLPAEDQKAVRQHFRGLTKENPVATLEHRIIMPDGQVRWQQWSDRAIFDEQGNLVEYQSVGRDITDRKMAEDGLKTAYEQITTAEGELREQYNKVKKREDALRESEENYRTLFDEAADLIAIVDVHGTFLNLNRKFEEESSYQREEMIGKNVLTSGIVTAPSAAKIVFHLGQLILGKNPPIFEIDGVAKDGTIVPYEMRATPIIKNGKISAVQAILRNLAGRKEAEREIRESRTRLEEIVHGSPIPQFVIDKDHVVISWNKSLEEYSGVKAKDVIGTTDTWKAFYENKRPVLADLLVDNAIDKIPEWYAGKSDRSKYVEGAYEATDFFPRMGKGGIWMYFTASAIRDSEGHIIGAVETLEDITERIRKEEALRESEEKFRDIFNNANDAIQIVELDDDAYPGRFIDVNDVACRMLQYSRDELLQKSPLDLETGYSSKPKDLIGKEMRTQGFSTFETEYARKDGRRIPVEVSVHPVILQGRHVSISVVRDITERKKAGDELRSAYEKITAAEEELRQQYEVLRKSGDALRASEAMYRAIFYNTGSATIIIDEDTTISFVNPEFERIMGYSKEEVEGKRYWTDFIVPEDVEQMNRYHRLRRIDPDKAPRNYEFRFIAKDRQVRDAYLTIGVIPGTKKTIASFVDITENKHAEGALKESERKYRSILENIQDVYYRSDQEGNLIMISPSGVRLLGYGSENELIGRNIAGTLYADPSERRLFLQALEKDGFVNNFDVTLKRHDGTTVPVETSSHKYYDEGGNFLGVEGIFRDITGRKRAEEALQWSEATYRTIFENTGTATVLIEENTVISLANAEFERLSEYSREEIERKKRWTEFVVKEDLERMLAQHRMRRERQESALKHYEFRFVTKSGAIRNIFLTIDMIPGTKRSVASLMDITDRIRA